MSASEEAEAATGTVRAKIGCRGGATTA